jgi:hypothetical protein
MTDYSAAYGDNPPRWASPTTHAVRKGTGKPARFGYTATSACGLSVRFGSFAQSFDPEASHACKRCASIVSGATR